MRREGEVEERSMGEMGGGETEERSMGEMGGEDRGEVHG